MMKARTLAAAFLFAAAAALGPAPARAQDEAAPAAAEREPRQIDSYGDIRHCDWTARLDNFAIELQNSPGSKGYVVSYSSPKRQYYASRQGRRSRYYLNESRGLEASRVVTVDAGVRPDLEEGLTELWFVPEGAEPPAAPAPPDRFAPDFSGKFDTYTADLNVYQWVSEMDTPDDDIARTEFASKLKQQPASVGYFVIRTPKGSPPGAWLRLARRDERLVSDGGVEVSRLKSLDGGAAPGEQAEIELWVLPLGAPPPAAEPAKVDWSLSAPQRLHTYENSFGQVGEDGERWMLANLAEFLRENPRASAWLVAREPQPEEEAGGGEAAGAAEEPAADTATEQTPAEVAADPAESMEGQEEEKELSMAELAESFRNRLVSEYGLAPERVHVKAGPAIDFNGGRIHMWVVPEKGPWPDTSARDEDELELERRLQREAEGEGAADRGATPR